MTSTGSIIGLRCMSGSNAVSKTNELKNFLLRLDKLLLQSLNLHLLVFILEQLQMLVVIEEIIDLASVNLIHRHSHSEVTRMVLKIIDPSVE